MKLLLASLPESETIGKRIAKQLKAEHVVISVEQFPDSEIGVALTKNPAHKTVVILGSLSHRPNDKLIECVLAAGIARDYGAEKVILVATYMPYMRQDTHFFDYDSFSSKYILKLLSSFDQIIAVDPHLHRLRSMKQLTGKASHISSVGLIADYIKKRFKNDFTIVGPDEESTQWSTPVARLLKKQVIVLHKDRFSSRRVRVRQNKGAEFKKHVIFIDDIISTGKTLMSAIALAKEQGARHVVCIGIHGLLIEHAAEHITKHAELITTNTITTPYSKIDIEPLLVRTLRHIVR